MVIRPTKLIKGQGLAKMMAEANLQAVGINAAEGCVMSESQEEQTSNLKSFYHQSPWYADIALFLTTSQCPHSMDKSQRRSLRLKVTKYCIWGANCLGRTMMAYYSNVCWKAKPNTSDRRYAPGDMRRTLCCHGNHSKNSQFGYYWPVF